MDLLELSDCRQVEEVLIRRLFVSRGYLIQLFWLQILSCKQGGPFIGSPKPPTQGLEADLIGAITLPSFSPDLPFLRRETPSPSVCLDEPQKTEIQLDEVP